MPLNAFEQFDPSGVNTFRTYGTVPFFRLHLLPIDSPKGAKADGITTAMGAFRCPLWVEKPGELVIVPLGMIYGSMSI